jgi:hypothetical protein
MEPVYHTPRELVEALHARAPAARTHLRGLVAPALGRLLGELCVRHGLEQDRELLTLHALHLAETWLRVRPLSSFDGMAWGAFRAAVLLHVAKQTAQPFGGGVPGAPAGPQPLPDSPGYQSATLFLPYDRLGTHRYGGDWFAGQRADDGSLWVILADVTGHGYHAYLLACCLPGVWQRCWAARAERGAEPADVLACMHELLTDSLPDGVFVECTLARLGTGGEVTVAPAGGTRLLVKRGGEAGMVKLRGAWLGLRAPGREEQHLVALASGDELVLATDGVFDQLEEEGGPEVALEGAEGQTLFERVRGLLDQSLARVPQRDDMTMVQLRRGAGASNGAVDVPV